MMIRETCTRSKIGSSSMIRATENSAMSMPLCRCSIRRGAARRAAGTPGNFRPRAVTESANDFTNFFALVDAVNAVQPEPYRSLVGQRMDVDEYTRILA